jgi:FlaA1/EpsC-like NDP-sugar epimerase
MDFFNNRRLLVTGCCGTVGRELVRLLLDDHRIGISSVIGIDNDESGIFFMSQQYRGDERANFETGDVRDRDRLIDLLDDVQVVLHCAALKHVELCEKVPFDAVQTNIHGVQNLIVAANKNNVERVIFTSSDKAVNPTNVMGTSKLMGERLITAANTNRRNGATIFASTRFGNVLGSSGSVMPLFRRQIEAGGPVTLTDRQMTRFVMSVEDSSRLVLNSVAHAKGGEVFITKMPVINIPDLAEVMIDHYASSVGKSRIKIEEIGTKPGEKHYEELMSAEETRRALELEDYFVVLPAFRNLYQKVEYSYPAEISRSAVKAYVSSEEPALSKTEMYKYLLEHNLLE